MVVMEVWREEFSVDKVLIALSRRSSSSYTLLSVMPKVQDRKTHRVLAQLLAETLPHRCKLAKEVPILISQHLLLLSSHS